MPPLCGRGRRADFRNRKMCTTHGQLQTRERVRVRSVKTGRGGAVLSSAFLVVCKPSYKKLLHTKTTHTHTQIPPPTPPATSLARTPGGRALVTSSQGRNAQLLTQDTQNQSRPGRPFNKPTATTTKPHFQGIRAAG